MMFTNKKELLKLCTLSGTTEIGRNCNFVEYSNEIVMIDAGYSFPGQEMYGIDYLIPNTSYLQKNKGKIKYIITDISYTHGEYNVSYYWERLGNSKNLIFKATSERNTKAIRTEFMHYLTEMNQIIQNQLVSLQAFISKPLFDEF